MVVGVLPSPYKSRTVADPPVVVRFPKRGDSKPSPGGAPPGGAASAVPRPTAATCGGAGRRLTRTVSLRNIHNGMRGNTYQLTI